MDLNISSHPSLKVLLCGLALACTALVPTQSSAQTLLVSYNGTSAEASSTGVGLTSGNLTAHGNVTFTSGANFPGRNLGYDTAGWPTGTTPPTYNLNSISFSITADATHQIELTELQMWFKSDGNGPDQVKLQLTVGSNPIGFNETVATGVLGLSDSSPYEFKRANNSGTALILQPNQTARFFIVGYDYKNTGGSTGLLITDIVVNGTVVPEPGTSALLLVGAMAGGMIWFRRSVGSAIRGRIRS